MRTQPVLISSLLALTAAIAALSPAWAARSPTGGTLALAETRKIRADSPEFEITPLGPSRWRLELENSHSVSSRWNNGVIVPIVENNTALSIRLHSTASFSATLIDGSGQTIDATAGLWPTRSARTLTARPDQHPARLLLCLGTTEPGEATFEIGVDAAVEGLEPAGLQEARNATAAAMLARARAKRDSVTAFVALADEIQSIAKSPRTEHPDAIRSAYTRWTASEAARSFYAPPLPDTRDEPTRRVLFACAVAHFAVVPTRDGGKDPVEIVCRGTGTCWQQAVVAKWILQALWPEGRPILLGSDPWRNGHCLATTDAHILDVSAGVVVPCSPRAWESFDDLSRNRFVRDFAWCIPTPFAFAEYKAASDVLGTPGSGYLHEMYSFVPLITFLLEPR